MASEVTVPSRTLRRSGRSAIGLLGLEQGLGRLDLPLPEDRVDAGDLLLHLSQPGVVVELAGDVLEAKVEELLLPLGQAGQQLVVAELPELRRGAHTISSDRVTNLALMGSFWMARSMASRASGSGTPDSSNMMRPGRTGATQCSGLPFPEPMRVSAGFSVTGLSGKIVIQTLPPRLTWRVMAIRAASIWRAVIQPGSRAWIP